MVTWGELRSLRPDLEAAGRERFYQFGVGLAFLATVRADGGPRLHPMCPVIDGDELYAFLIPSPKRRDLQRDGRYAMHSFPTDDNEDAFSIRGSATAVHDTGVRDVVGARFLAERKWSEPPPDFAQQELFAFDIESCLLTTTAGHGDPHPTHTVWHAPA
jgi:pyridoxamine 5'-phosphate oxidase-like protein